jgi:hypothetical protein
LLDLLLGGGGERVMKSICDQTFFVDGVEVCLAKLAFFTSPLNIVLEFLMNPFNDWNIILKIEGIDEVILKADVALFHYNKLCRIIYRE